MWRGTFAICGRSPASCSRAVAFGVLLLGPGVQAQPAWIEIAPNRAFIGEPVGILLRGFAPTQLVTVRVCTTNFFGKDWTSHALFRTDMHGCVNVPTQAPLSGTYRRADPLGLFWSMSRLMDRTAPLVPGHESLDPVSYELTAQADERKVATAIFQRILVAPGVTRVAVQHGRLRGALFVPPGAGPYPGIIVLGGSEGGLHEIEASFLASKGYAALALAYFGYDDLPKSLENIPLEYFQAAINWLKVRSRDLAVMGASRGAELALLLGSKFPEIHAVVAIAPSGVLWGGIAAEGGSERPAWTYQGRALPFMDMASATAAQGERINKILQSNRFSSSALFQILMEDQTAVQKSSISVERINGPVMLISGGDDRVWPSSELANMVMKRLNRAKHPFPDCHLVYQGAGHFIPLPSLPATVNRLVHPITKMELPLGGGSEATAAASKDSWARIIRFLDEKFDR